MHQALYRKWRPSTFEDVYGQEHITSILKYETANNKFSHAYLFCGSRGTGKTTCAKILSKAVNCESPVNGNPCNCCPSCQAIISGTTTDVLEMDAASNNGVENIRDIRDEVVYTPSALKYRVYIVDEVHMLSPSAFNALLKTLEEPPSHVVFILATTELHKLPATIISRCQRFDFRRITVSDIMSRLAVIAQNEKIEYENVALRIIAKFAQGGMRDAISLFELCAGNNQKVTASRVESVIGSSGSETVAKVFRAISARDYDSIFSVIDEIVRSSRDITVFWNDMISYCRDILVSMTTEKASEYLDLTESETKTLLDVASKFTRETIVYYLRLLNDSLYTMQRSGGIRRNVAEMTLIKMCDENLDTSPDAILSRISKLESQLAMGVTFNEAKNTVAAPKKVSKIEKTETKSEVEAVSASSEINSIKPKSDVAEKVIKGWSEICDRATESDPSVTAMLKISKGYFRPDGSVVVKFFSEFAKNMFLDSGLSKNLASAIALERACELNEKQIEYILVDKEEIKDDFDDITQD